MSIHEVFLATIGRWLGLVALAVLVGGLVLDLIVLPRHVGELASARRRIGRWTTVTVVVLIVSSAVDLLARARIMSGGDLAQVGAALPLVLTRTHFGAIWIARGVVLGLLVIVSVFRSLPFRIAGLVLALGVALTGSLTGHASDWGDRSFTVLVDFLHAVAALSWTGGLFGFALTVRQDWGAWSTELVGMVARRFSRLAGYCLLVVVSSGIYNTWAQVPTVTALWTTTYGVALLLKIFLALVLAFLGAINRYLLLPGLGSGRSVCGAVIAPSAAAASLSRLVGREALVAVVVFGCTAVLGESTPKSHEGHVPPGADREGSAARVTMEALHASGGVPKDWIFAPPDGDPRKGREVFERLECFTCHAVAGEKFPRPSRPGPGLTDVGRHHPAGYLFESVINPNAVIVEAPGYTGPNGRSIMPDYRDSLSARELIDLVAYLKSLGG